MENVNATPITVTTTVNAPIEKVWEYFNTPKHVEHWCAASDDWHVPHAESDFTVGGRSNTRMEAKDGSFGFDFEWTYTAIKENELVTYTLNDDRKVAVQFEQTPDGVLLTETFDPESENPAEMQRAGWQAILDNFKKYTESN